MLLKLTFNILTTSAILFLASCKGISKEEIELYRQLDSSLINSNKTINSSTLARMRSLEDKTFEPFAKEKAEYWYQKAENISSITKDSYTFIEEIRKKLVKTTANEQITKAVRNLLSPTRLNELHKKLVDCKLRLQNIEPTMDSIVGTSIPIKSDINNLLVEELPVSAVLVKLIKLQNDLKLSENMLITFCDLKVPRGDGYDVFRAVINGTSKFYHPGDKAEIFAGIGGYSSNAFPEITVNGKKFERTVEGDFQYSFKVSDKPGSYEVPIVIKYIDPHTKLPISLKKIIRYTVELKCSD